MLVLYRFVCIVYISLNCPILNTFGREYGRPPKRDWKVLVSLFKCTKVSIPWLKSRDTNIFVSQWKWQPVDFSKSITWQRRKPGLSNRNTVEHIWAHWAGGSGESLNVLKVYGGAWKRGDIDTFGCLKLALGGTFLWTCPQSKYIQTLWMLDSYSTSPEMSGTNQKS